MDDVTDGEPLVSRRGQSISPINRMVGDLAPRQFSGDDPHRAHRILSAAGKTVPKPTEKTGLVIVGGGISGLVSAYLLRDQNPVLLEQADRFGGNSKGESWRGMDYSIGAAYFMQPDDGSALQKLYSDLDLDELYRIKETEDPVLLAGKRFGAFWSGETDPKQKRQFTQLKAHFLNVLNGENGLSYPDLPIEDPGQRKAIEQLETQSFRSYLESVVGGKLHPHIETVIQYYCYSSLGASASEISAAAGLNFYAAEFGAALVCPGGNAAVAERILARIAESVPLRNLRAGCSVIHVEVNSDGVCVGYLDPDGEVKSILAQAVIMACPKFVVKHVVRNLEPERIKAISKLQYRSYLVGNVLVHKKTTENFYDLFLLGDGKPYPQPGITDVILANFAHADPERTVLTLYRGIPSPNGRQELFSEGAFEKFRSQFETQIRSQILPALGVAPTDVSDLRMTRWGHPMPLAQPGFISSGVIDQLRKPFQERVFFVEQDNWMLPAFETGASEAISFEPQVRDLLAKSKQS